ncbi:MAG: tetratricopeptide repeat protein [Planctomycetaceae bacterium]|nr:tetratricopeptide repeat protein [Planctomycetaceae bacterium]
MKIIVRLSLAIVCGFLVSIFGQTAKAQDEIKLEPPPEDPKAPRVRMYSPDETIQFFETKVNASPKNTFLLTKLGQAYLFSARQTGNESHYGEAEKVFHQVLKLKPESVAVRAQLAAVFMAQHRFREALKMSQEVYRKDAKYTLALANIGDAFLELGQYDEAERSFQELKKKTPAGLPEVLARLARIAELRGRTKEALQHLNEALEQEQANKPHSPEIAWYHFRLGEVYFGCGQIENANKHLEASLKLRKDYVGALLALGQVRAAQGRYREAADLYEKAVAQKPDFDLIGDMGTLYGLAGNSSKAKQLEEKAISLVPEAKKIETEARHLALFLADREIQLDLALESAQKELKVREDVFAYDVLAWVLFKSGQTQAAWDASEKALRIGTRDANFHFHAGLIARKLGRLDKARMHLEKALEINPHFGFTNANDTRKALTELKSE